MTVTLLPPILIQSNMTTTDPEGQFYDETSFSGATKRQLFNEWRYFIFGGFKRHLFTTEIYKFLVAHCAFVTHYNQDMFWRHYFCGHPDYLKAFINQFGEQRRSAVFGERSWMGGVAPDLKEAMCAQMIFLREPFLVILRDLEVQHIQIGQMWREFGMNAGITDPGVPPGYVVNENTHNNLEHIATRVIGRVYEAQTAGGMQIFLPTIVEQLRSARHAQT